MNQTIKLKFLLMSFILMGITLNGQRSVEQLWSEKIPNSIVNPNYNESFSMASWGEVLIDKVTNPNLIVYPATSEINTGTAVLICPGGGYGIICIDQEGTATARWLNQFGITGIVLKYRLPSDKIMKDKSVGPLQDAQEAMRVIRRNAAKWGINPTKIGVMGYSAGGHLASTLSTHFAEKVYSPTDTVSARPDFSILIYPVISMQIPVTHTGSREALLGLHPDTTQINRFSNDLQVTKNTPPAFIIHASDDGCVPVQNSLNYYTNLVKNKVPVEMHIYQKGDHGFGLGTDKPTASEWPAACIKWLHSNGW